MPKQIPDEQILSAAVEVIAERGFKAATTKQIAARAGINEVTLFRRFGSKAELLREALAREAGSFVESGITPTGDLRGDLERVVGLYAERVQRVGRLLPVVLGELAREPEMAPILAEPRRMASAVVELISHYQAQGELEPEPPLQAVLALFGPIMAAGLLAGAVEDPPPMPEPEEFVRRYLDGRTGRKTRGRRSRPA